MIEKKLEELISLVRAWIDRQELSSGGCVACQYAAREPWEDPCRMCRRNCKDYWRLKEDD